METMLIEFFHKSPMLLPLAEGTKVSSVFIKNKKFFFGNKI